MPIAGKKLYLVLNWKTTELLQRMERLNLAEYLNLINSPRRYMYVNFMGGIFRGFGIGIGMTIIAAVIIYILQRLLVLNLPVISDFIAELVKIMAK